MMPSFELLLTNIKDIINKGLQIPKIFLKKVFKFWLCNRSGALIAILILGLFEIDKIIKK